MSSLEMKNRQNNGKRVSGSDALFPARKTEGSFLEDVQTDFYSG